MLKRERRISPTCNKYVFEEQEAQKRVGWPQEVEIKNASGVRRILEGIPSPYTTRFIILSLILILLNFFVN